jgi:translation initiation factor IF-3
VRVNERIRIPEIRLIDEDGSHIGVIRTRDALEMARERGLDLVEVQPNASPPVCRLMDYGKFRYEESRRERESRKRQKSAIVKEVRLRPKIDEHDLETKGRQVQRFLEAGDKVKLSVLFRGREIAHQDIGRELLVKLSQQLDQLALIDQPPHMEGRTMVMFLSPGRAVSTESGAEPDQVEP